MPLGGLAPRFQFKKAMKRQSFHSHFINLVYQCISSTNLAVIINGEPTAIFHPQRGVRQGCPLSPYLFVLAINELSICLQTNMDLNNIQGVTALKFILSFC